MLYFHTFNVYIRFLIVSFILSFNHPTTTHGEILLDVQNLTRICLRVAENEVYQPGFRPTPDYCKGWNCWQSQLRVSNKIRISLIVNTFRNQLATKDNIVNMHQLTWHWTLEQEAIRASKQCNRRYLEKYEELRTIEGLGSSLRCENGCLYETISQTPSQNLLTQLLYDLLLNNSLQDFDLDGKFRRGNAMFFGCSLVIRSTLMDNKIEDVYHLVCVFCTTEPEMTTIYGGAATEAQCSSLSVRGADPMHPQLCSVEGRESIYICSTYYICKLEPQQKPLISQLRDPGEIMELIMVETESGPMIMVKKEDIGGYDDYGVPIYHKDELLLDSDGKFLKILSHYPQIPKAAYAHLYRNSRIYDGYLQKLTNGTARVQRPVLKESPVVYEPTAADEGSEDAWCCIYMFGLSSILTCVLMVLIWYTIFTR